MRFLFALNVRLTINRFCSSRVRVRFAPSPTGQIHLGGLRTALYNYLFARSRNGDFILRIEDTDQSRLVPCASDKLEQMLDWMGLVPDESPIKGGTFGPYVQSERLKLYSDAAEHLVSKGLAFKCFCSEKRLDLMRKEAIRSRTNFKYDGRCRGLNPDEITAKISSGLPYTIRFKFEQGPEDEMTFQDFVFGEIKSSSLETEGDLILVKSDGWPTYHLANVVDDHHMKITHVLRGQEWQISTPKHLMLYRAFGWTPPVYAHLPLIINEDGSKLSKRQSDIHLEHYKNEGFYPEAILNFLTLSGGAFKDRDQSGDVVYTLKELVEMFDFNHLKTNSCQVNFERLVHFNQKFLQKKLSDPNCESEILSGAKTILRQHFKDQTDFVSDETLLKQIKWAHNRLTRLKDITLPEFAFLLVAPSSFDYSGSLSCDVLPGAAKILDSISEYDDLTSENVSKSLRQYSKSMRYKFPEVMKLLRLVLSGIDDGPPVGEMVQLLGKRETLKRIHSGYEILKSKTQ